MSLDLTGTSVFSTTGRQTLTARATRLESTSSKVRLAAEKEAYRRMTVAKRRRAQGPKNASDFMRQTIRDREESREKNRVRAERRAANTQLQAESAVICLGGVLDQPTQRGTSSGGRLASPFRESTHSHYGNRPTPTSSVGSSCAGHSRSIASDRRERPQISTRKVWYDRCRHLHIFGAVVQSPVCSTTHLSFRVDHGCIINCLCSSPSTFENTPPSHHFIKYFYVLVLWASN